MALRVLRRYPLFQRRTLPVLFLLGTAAIAAAAEPGERWVRATPQAETTQIIDRAVDAAAANVSWAFRGIARPQLAKHATACEGYRFEIEGDRFQVRCDDEEPFAWTVGQKGTISGADGRESTVDLRRQGSTYDLKIESARGGKSWRYAFDDGDRLVVTQRIFSPHLSEDMVWVLTYQRAP